MGLRHVLVAVALAVAFAWMPPAAVSVGGQAPAAAAATTYKPATSNYVPPKTPWGDPDIQGVWDYQSMIPMQRPAELAGKATFTEAELAEWAKQRSPNQDQCGYGTKANQECTTAQLDNVGGYNEFWDCTDPACTTRHFVKDYRTSLIEDPSDGRIPPMTPEGRARMDEYNRTRPPSNESAGGVNIRSWDDFPAITRCIAEQTPNGPQMYNSGTYIQQVPGWVLIVRERLDTRVIAMDGRPAPGPQIRLWNGHSRGRWEGNTLVVETTNFTDKQIGGGVGSTVPAGVPFGNIRLTERFVPVSATRIHYYATVEDPTTWTRPWTFMLPWQKYDGYKLYEYACNEANISVGNALKGTLRQDEMAAKAKLPGALGTLVGSTEASVRERFGEPVAILGPRWEYEAVSGHPVYVFFTEGKVVSIRPNDLAFDQVRRR
jgi:hypothetical protein